MKILISSHAFAPSIGGLETVTELLAREFVRVGHEVRIVTRTPNGPGHDAALPVVRKPSLATLLDLLRWCDVLWQSNLSLRTFWPTLFVRRPTVVTHHGSYARVAKGLDFRHRLKLAVLSQTTGVSISQHVAAQVDPKSTIIPNPYDVGVFHSSPPGTIRKLELLFVGRLVSEKGLDILIAALSYLRDEGLRPRLTVVGAGPELAAIQASVSRHHLGEQVTFEGIRRGLELAEIYRRHRILVVPSRYDEPFGVVAVEGIACGCVVVGSAGGGLPEAIGPCGLLFPNGDANALVQKLRQLLTHPAEEEKLRAKAGSHLTKFQPAIASQSYLSLFARKLR